MKRPQSGFGDRGPKAATAAFAPAATGDAAVAAAAICGDDLGKGRAVMKHQPGTFSVPPMIFLCVVLLRAEGERVRRE